MHMTEPIPVPIPAATVIVMRDRVGAPPQLLMVERAAAMRFAGGALVFPGGRIDAGDRVAAATMAGDADDLAGRVAARWAVTGDPFAAACEAVWLHGDAARRAGAAFVADDLIAQIAPTLEARL